MKRYGLRIWISCVLLLSLLLSSCVPGDSGGTQAGESTASVEPTDVYSPESSERVDTEPSEPEDTASGADPTDTASGSEPTPSEPTPSEPIPSEPTPSEPIPSEPIPSEPIPSEPEPTDPEDNEPEDTEPEDTEPEDTEPEDTEPEDTEPEPTESSEEEPPIYTDPTQTDPPVQPPHWHNPPDFPYIFYNDLNGYLFRAYVRGESAGGAAFACEDFWSDGTENNAIAYATWKRNCRIEGEFNCKILQVLSTMESTYEELRQASLAGESFELSILPGADSAAAACAGLLKNLIDVETLTYYHAAFDDASVEQLILGDTLYFLSGDMNISPLDSAHVTLFQKELFEGYDFPALTGKEEYRDLYEMVADGTWTVDAMLEMARAAESAGEGNVGYFRPTEAPAYYYYALDARISEVTVTFDEGECGTPDLVFGTAHAKERFDFLLEKMSPDAIPAVGDGEAALAAFRTGKTLFTDARLLEVRRGYHEADVSFGILPIPKYSAEQENYCSIVYVPDGAAHLWSMPSSCQTWGYAGFLIQVMAVHSRREGGTMEAYFDDTLRLTVARDAGSRASLLVVRDTLIYDAALFYDWGKFAVDALEALGTSDAKSYDEVASESALLAAREEMEASLSLLMNCPSGMNWLTP